MSRFPVRSIDVGYGNTKFVIGEESGMPLCQIIPSLAPFAPARRRDFSADGMSSRATAVVNVDGEDYEVGLDAERVLAGASTRTLDSNFATTDLYLALVRGAFHFMGATEIGLLTVGLPMSTIDTMAVKLQQRLTGTHVLSNPKADHKRVVNVHAVRVLPQPLGAFFDYMARTNQFEQMRTKRCLIIDPGYLTVDWLLCDGLKVMPTRSGAYSGGVSTMVDDIVDVLSAQLGGEVSHLAVETALRHNKPIKAYSQETPLENFKVRLRTKTMEAASAIQAKVGSGSDVDLILMGGGGAHLYLDSVREKFPRTKVDLIRDPVFANVRGFQISGEQYAKKRASVAV